MFHCKLRCMCMDVYALVYGYLFLNSVYIFYRIKWKICSRCMASTSFRLPCSATGHIPYWYVKGINRRYLLFFPTISYFAFNSIRLFLAKQWILCVPHVIILHGFGFTFSKPTFQSHSLSLTSNVWKKLYIMLWHGLLKDHSLCSPSFSSWVSCKA